MQVQQQVIEIITYISSTAAKFPKKCVVLCITGKCHITKKLISFDDCYTLTAVLLLSKVLVRSSFA